MQLTHLGHAAVLVEAAGKRILVDPGNFSTSWHSLRDLDAICITHQHPDHVDPQHLPALADANPQAAIFVEAGVPQTAQVRGMQPMQPGESWHIGGVSVQALGGCHAVIHRDIPRIGNLGFVFTEPGGTSFFHPGDSLETTPPGVDVLAIPTYGPWAAMKETIDFIRAVDASYGFPIHEGLVNERGFALLVSRMAELSSTRVLDLRDGDRWVVPEDLPA